MEIQQWKLRLVMNLNGSTVFAFKTRSLWVGLSWLDRLASMCVCVCVCGFYILEMGLTFIYLYIHIYRYIHFIILLIVSNDAWLLIVCFSSFSCLFFLVVKVWSLLLLLFYICMQCMQSTLFINLLTNVTMNKIWNGKLIIN